MAAVDDGFLSSLGEPPWRDDDLPGDAEVIAVDAVEDASSERLEIGDEASRRASRGLTKACPIKLSR